MSKSPYYCRFTGDYARDTSHLSLIQHGAYTVLLDFYYSSGKSLPADVNALCRICRAFDDVEREAVSQVVAQFFELRADGYHNKRADSEIAYRAEQHERLSKGAQKTNRKRWSKPSPSESPSDTLSGRIPSPSPSPYSNAKKEKPSANAVSDSLPVADGFEEFYKAYPKHVGKEAAWRAWRKVKPEEATAILARVELNKLGEWARKDKQYIPNPATWLNGRRWEDEILPGGANEHSRVSAGAVKPKAGKYDGLSVVRAVNS